ncbi:type I restriction-modification system subunit M [Brachyspira innocens]|uniref:site-specific DNA-methyltransferase (adenine-specific) n=1 Tax=Brachyspira innocens TaxID=13264 RepID=A0ABT8Z0N8_9SPIR|nr:type I restriction-modification system subunit M [Brachyspira innocens]MDO6994879.1 type I restriction-modification system subunit M [Brachyspira innocens]MDO7021300.1 type I restriction-modification system subunit M [Brachyspira innocens]
MADNKSIMERDELHSKIWKIADDLRGSVDGWDFKQYVLGMLFYRYISEHLANYLNQNEWDAGLKDFNYASLKDEDVEHVKKETIEEQGFFIYPSELFENIRKEANNQEAKKDGKEKHDLNEKLQKIFKDIENSAKGTKSEEKIAGLFDDIDVNSNKLGPTVLKRNERLKKLINGIADIELGDFKDHSIDAFGDAYEYLMGMYASSAGKSGGEFFTPQEVSELLTRIAVTGKSEIRRVYDPACGSGSLLLKFKKILKDEEKKIHYFGQEINITTYNLCRINMFLHDIGYSKFDIAHGDTLTEPKHKDDQPFDAIVSNPPYSIKWEGEDNTLLINDPRYSPAGILAPKSKADFAFIMHSLSWLDTAALAAIVCFPGIMYRGGAEQKIRKYLIDNNYIECIIQLPDNLFYGTQIATCIMVLSKSKIDGNTLFIDASEDYEKATNNNKLSDKNIEDILSYFKGRETKKYKCYLASKEEIESQDYNLSVSTYVEQKDTREKVDIKILNKELEEIVLEENKLRKDIAKIIEEIEK